MSDERESPIEPKRLREGEPSLERTLLASARGEGPSPEARRRAAIALGFEVPNVPPGESSPANSPRSRPPISTSPLVAKLVVAVVLGGLTAAGVSSLWLHRAKSSPPTTTSPEVPMPPVPAAPTTSPIDTDKAAAPQPVDAPVHVNRPASHRSATPASNVVTSTATIAPLPSPVAVGEVGAVGEVARSPRHTSSLADEVLVLDTVREAMSHHAFRAALDTLAEYQREFPHGLLEPEATALRIETLSRIGEDAQARRLGETFLLRFPASPLTSKVRALMQSSPQNK